MPLRLRRAVPLLVLAVAAWLGGAPIAEAHPHMFVEYAVLVRFGAGGVESAEVRWTFDEFTSALIQRQFDKDGDGKLSPDEVRQVERRHFAETRESQYFLSVRLNGAELLITTARDFGACVASGRVSYVFTVPLAAGAPGRLELMADDPSIYAAFDLDPKAPVRVEAPRTLAVGCEVIRDPKGAVLDFVRCDFRRGSR